MKYTSKFYEIGTFERYLESERAKQVTLSACNTRRDRILDVGPGLRPYCYYLDGYNEYVVIEPNRDFTKTYPCSKDIISVNCTLEEYEADETFDFIILSSILHMVVDVDSFLAKVRNLCNDNTLIHINVPNAQSLHRLLGLQMGLLNSIDEKSSKDAEYEHHHNFTIESLIDALTRNDLTVSAWSTYMIKPLSDKQMSKFIDPKMADGLSKLIDYLPFYGCEIALEAEI